MLVLPATSAAAQPRLHVNVAAEPGGDGRSWKTAFQHLQEALDAAQPDTQEIWVARGTYLPTRESQNGVPRSRTFDLPSGLALYGGFAGDESDLEQRDIASNPTVLSADHNGDDGPDFANRSDNSFHIARILSAAAPLFIDGFILQGGSARAANDVDAGGALLIDGGDVHIANCAFDSNEAGSLGGAIGIVSGAISLEACTFSRNRSLAAGGAVGSSSSASAIDTLDTEFEENSAADGGAIALQGGAATFNACTFSLNSASDDGGALYAPVSPGPVTELTLTGCTATDNTAGDRGGVGYFFDTNFTAGNSTFQRNRANGQHGVFFIINNDDQKIESATFIGSVFEDNSSNLSNGAIGLASEYLIERCRFERNTSVQGGACTLSGFGEVANCSFIDNRAGLIGALAVLDTALVRDTEFIGNISDGVSPIAGGLLIITAVDVSILRCRFIGNEAIGNSTSGGGAAVLLTSAPGTARFVHCAFLQNRAIGSAARGGGAAVSLGAQNRCDFSGCLFNGNEAANGGALSISSGSSDATNCTFVHNIAATEGGALLFDRSSMLLANSILWDNSAPAGSEIAMASGAGGTLTVRFCNVRGGESKVEPGGGILIWDGNSNIDLDANFYDQDGDDDIPGNADDDLRIFGSSPSTDTGNNGDVAPDLLDLDADGNTAEPTPRDFFRGPRIFAYGKFPIVDMGFAEWRWRTRGRH